MVIHCAFSLALISCSPTPSAKWMSDRGVVYGVFTVSLPSHTHFFPFSLFHFQSGVLFCSLLSAFLD
jgi:hypothetical protein